MFDSHCHLDFSCLQGELDAHLERARKAGVKAWLIPGCHEQQWEALDVFCLEGRKRGDEFWVGVGQHPYWSEEVMDLDAFCEGLTLKLHSLGGVAVGEIGLDQGRGATLVIQERLFEAQLALAHELDLPVILHQTGSHEPFLRSLKRVGVPRAGALLHGFSGRSDWGEALLKRGLCLGVGPAITRDSRSRLQEAVQSFPLDRLLLETDAPDQRPAAGGDLGVPADLSAVCAKLAELRGQCPQEVGKLCEENAREFFRLPKKEDC